MMQALSSLSSLTSLSLGWPATGVGALTQLKSLSLLAAGGAAQPLGPEVSGLVRLRRYK